MLTPATTSPGAPSAPRAEDPLTDPLDAAGTAVPCVPTDPTDSTHPSDPTPVRDPLPAGQVVVLGLMGAGKTTLASRLAAMWGRPLRDSDADLRRTTGRSAAELAGLHGREALHDLEAAHLLDALAGPPCVIAAAASTVERAECRKALADAFVVWLDADPRALAARQETGSHRPVYEADLEHMLIEMDRARRPRFTEVADLIVDLGDLRSQPGGSDREWHKQALAEAVAAAVADQRGTTPRHLTTADVQAAR